MILKQSSRMLTSSRVQALLVFIVIIFSFWITGRLWTSSATVGHTVKPFPPGGFFEEKEENSHLRKLCDSQKWTEGLWLSCHSKCGAGHAVCGGLNNARNRLQSCLRLAIDAGAGLVIPPMSTRSEKDLDIYHGNKEVCLDKFWNIKQIEENLKEECPQLRLQLCGNTNGTGKMFESHGIRHYSNNPLSPSKFRTIIEADLKCNNVTDINVNNPVRIDFHDPMFSWNYTSSGELETIRKDLFRQLPYNSDVLQLGDNILELTKAFRPLTAVHLRGEQDWPAHYGTANQQMDAFTKDLRDLRETDANISNIYVSCGDQQAVQTFREKLTPLNFTVHDKWTLTAAAYPDLLAKIENLSFDQKAIVEYRTLTAADYFLGMGLSSMSLLVAFNRTLDDKEDYFPVYILENSTRGNGLYRKFPVSPVMKGNGNTRLMMLNGDDIMDTYP